VQFARIQRFDCQVGTYSIVLVQDARRLAPYLSPKVNLILALAEGLAAVLPKSSERNNYLPYLTLDQAQC